MSYKLETLSQNKSTWQIHEYANIGSDDSCHIKIEDSGISDRHSRIEEKNNKLFIKDLRSANGTFINGAQILEAQLNDGDIITVGETELVVHDSNEKKMNFPMQSKNQIWSESLKTLDAVCLTNHTVLLLGASGSGKDVIAKNIHAFSERKNEPFLSVNCSALTETLVESELFGHVKGSFTGAINDRKGAFEAARNGTLFLDEIGDLSYPLQAKLLRALENSEIRPVGSDRTIKTDVRIIAATHQNLYEKIREGSFRSDLFYRLNVINVEVPDLVNRLEDFETIIYQFAKAMRVRFSFHAIEVLKKYNWPGNIRELKNLVTRAATLYPKQYITDELVNKLLQKQEKRADTVTNNLISSQSNTDIGSLSVIKEIEKQMIIKRLSANRGSQKRTAADLGMPKSTLHDRLKNYKINASSFREF
jgi:transcriptional regulator with GAF, ATPase, and Fis domain